MLGWHGLCGNAWEALRTQRHDAWPVEVSPCARRATEAPVVRETDAHSGSPGGRRMRQLVQFAEQSAPSPCGFCRGVLGDDARPGSGVRGQGVGEARLVVGLCPLEPWLWWWGGVGGELVSMRRAAGGAGAPSLPSPFAGAKVSGFPTGGVACVRCGHGYGLWFRVRVLM